MAPTHLNENHSNQTQVVVVMVPFPAQGHLNQLLQLSRLILPYNIPVHFVGAATHNRQAMLRIHGWDPNSTADIHFHDFTTPSFLTPPPNPDLEIKFPSHLQPSFDASSYLREPLSQLLRSLSSKSRRVIVIFDTLMASVVQEVTSIPNAESYSLHSVSAFTVFMYVWETVYGGPLLLEASTRIPKDTPSLEGCFSQDFLDFIAGQYELLNIDAGSLYNTTRAVESPYMELMEKIEGDKKHWAVGPFNPVTIEKKSLKGRHFCLEWLDKQEPKTVIYVSFGTTTAMADPQIIELARGLEQSQHKFIWVLRDADRGDVFDGEVRRFELPKGFEERVKGTGLVIRDWAPQLEILNHPSTGGFMSHCGWNSCMESISMGVPIAAWPIHSDQPRNTVLITTLLKVGVVVKDWARRGELVTSTTVEKSVKRLMASKEGDEIKKRAEELGRCIRQSLDAGGASRLELDSFITHITRH